MLEEMINYENYAVYFKNNKVRVICSNIKKEKKEKSKTLINDVLEYSKELNKLIRYEVLDFSNIKKTYKYCLDNYRKRPDILDLFYDFFCTKGYTENKLFIELYIKLHILHNFNYEEEVKIIASEILKKDYEYEDNSSIIFFNYEGQFEQIMHIIVTKNDEYNDIFISTIHLLDNFDYIDLHYNTYFKNGVSNNNIYHTKYIRNLFHLNPIYIIELKNFDEIKQTIITFLKEHGSILSLDYIEKKFYNNEIRDYLPKNSDDKMVLLHDNLVNFPLIILNVQNLYNRIKYKDDRNSTTTKGNISKVVNQYNYFQKYLNTIPYTYNYKPFSTDIEYSTKNLEIKCDFKYDKDYYIGFKISEKKHYKDLMFFVFDRIMLNNSGRENPYVDKQYCLNCNITEDEAPELKDKRVKYCNKCKTIISKEKARNRKRKQRAKEKLTNLQ